MNRERKIRSPRHRAILLLVWISLLACSGWNKARGETSAQNLFEQASASYATNGFETAAALFREAASNAPASGTLRNLGNAEWQSGHPGRAILAWERARWLDPFDRDIREDLRFARTARQLDAPELTWYETCSMWLPMDAWAWIACASFWLAIAMILLPGALRWRKASWHQGIAAAGFAVFLLTLPALAGVQTRSRLAVILPNETPLRLTPTTEGQVLSRLPAGEMARLQRQRGTYIFIRTGGAAGWVQRAQLGLLSGE